MPDGLTGFVTDITLHLLSGFVLLRCFLPPPVKHRGWPLLLCSVLFMVLGLLVETILDPFMREGTLVFLFFFCILLANRICKLPLIHAAGALFCHFSFMLGLGLLQSAAQHQDTQTPTPEANAPAAEEDLEELLEAGILEGAPPTPTPPPPSRKTAETTSQSSIRVFHDRMLHRKLARSRTVLLKVLYPEDQETPIPTPTPGPVPTPLPPRPTPVPGSVMDPAEFFHLFAPTPTPFPRGTDSIPVNPTPVRSEQVVDPGDAVAVNSQQLHSMVKLRNRSTDPSYPPPEFEIDALGIGANGRYAIVNGTLMREGNIIRLSAGVVRGWRLVKIRENQLFWQPLL